MAERQRGYSTGKDSTSISVTPPHLSVQGQSAGGGESHRSLGELLQQWAVEGGGDTSVMTVTSRAGRPSAAKQASHMEGGGTVWSSETLTGGS